MGNKSIYFPRAIQLKSDANYLDLAQIPQVKGKVSILTLFTRELASHRLRDSVV